MTVAANEIKAKTKRFCGNCGRSSSGRSSKFIFFPLHQIALVRCIYVCFCRAIFSLHNHCTACVFACLCVRPAVCMRLCVCERYAPVCCTFYVFRSKDNYRANYRLLSIKAKILACCAYKFARFTLRHVRARVHVGLSTCLYRRQTCSLYVYVCGVCTVQCTPRPRIATVQRSRARSI